MINYNTLAGSLKRDLAKFSQNISEGLKRPVMKFILQMLYGILAGNKVHLSEIARCLDENIKLKKTICHLNSIRGLNLFATLAVGYLGIFYSEHEIACNKKIWK